MKYATVAQKSLLNNTIWNTAGSIVYFACQWLITIIVVWLYDDFTNAGNLALAMSITNIFYNIAIYNIRTYQVSDISNEFSDKEYIIARVVTCTGAIILCLFFIIISGYQQEQFLIIICYMGFRAVEAFIDVLHGIVHKHRRLDYAGISMISRGILTLVIFCVLGYFFNLLSAIIGMFIITLFFGLFYDIPVMLHCRNISKPDNVSIDNTLTSDISYTWRRVGMLLKRCLMLMLVILMFTFFASYTRYALERLYGAEVLGAYAAAVTPSIALQLGASFILAPLINLFSECKKNADTKRFLKILSVACFIITGLTVISVLIAYILGEWGLKLLFGSDILPYTYLLPDAMIVAGLTAMLWLMNVVFSVIRDIRGIFFGCIVGVICCVITSEVLLRIYGINSVNYIMMLTQSIVLIILFIRFIYAYKGERDQVSSLL